jgi:anti-sigma factor RsiW
MNQPAFSDADLNAYVDGQLPPDRRAEVESLLAVDAEAAARVKAYQAQTRALREIFDPVLDEPLPASLRQLATPPAQSAPSPTARPRWLPSWSLQRMAASLLIAVLGGVIGWVGHGRYQPTEMLARTTPFYRQAAVAHAVFSPDVRRPVEVTAEQEDQLVTWLSKRMGTPVRPPKLGTVGYELVGGRLLPGGKGPVAQFMYQDSTGQRLTLYVSTEIAGNNDTAFRFAEEGAVKVFYWVDGKFGYALSAGIAKNELARIATAVYEQLERK